MQLGPLSRIGTVLKACIDWASLLPLVKSPLRQRRDLHQRQNPFPNKQSNHHIPAKMRRMLPGHELRQFRPPSHNSHKQRPSLGVALGRFESLAASLGRQEECKCIGCPGAERRNEARAPCDSPRFLFIPSDRVVFLSPEPGCQKSAEIVLSAEKKFGRW